MDERPTEQINFLGVGITILVLIALSFFIDMGSLKEWIATAGIWAPLIFILLKASTIIIAPLSGSPLYPLVGLFFGFWPGLLYVSIGDFIGYTVTFFISRIFGQKAVMKMISKKEEGILSKIVEHIGTGKGFFHACLTCFALPELLSYSAGLSRLSYQKFIFILWPASTLAAGTLVFFGSAFDTSDKPFLIAVGVPLFGAICMIIGGSLFIKTLKKKE